MKTLSFLTFIIMCLFWGCASNTPIETGKKGISLEKEIRIALLEFRDESEIEKLEKWPKNPKKAKQLLKTFEKIQTELKNRIGNASRLNRIKIVHQSQNPGYRIQLIFEKAIPLKDGCQIPYTIKVYDQINPDNDFEFSQAHQGIIQFKEESANEFYYWSDILADYIKEFPYTKITENLFIL